MALERIERQIKAVIDQNAFTLSPRDRIYYGHMYHKRLPFKYAQFFGTKESSSAYVRSYNANLPRSGDRRNQYLLHEYTPLEEIKLLNFTHNAENSAQIQHFLDLLSQLVRVSKKPTMDIDLRTVQLIALFSHIFFGLDLRYDAQQIDDLVENVAETMSYPYHGLSVSFVKQLLSIIHHPRNACQASRVSFRNFDKTLISALKLMFGNYNIPAHGICYFMTQSEASPNACCHRISKQIAQFAESILCVPSEYIIFHPDQYISYRQSNP